MATKKKFSAADVLSQISAVATPVKAKSGSKTKWEMVLTDEAKIDALRWISAKAVYDPIEARLKQAKEEFNSYAFRIMAEKLFASKSKPSNPIVVLYKEDGTVDHQFQFVMMDKFEKPSAVPEDLEPRDYYINQFVDVGLHPADAESLVDNELVFDPIVGIKTFTELLSGKFIEAREFVESTTEEKVAGQKLAAIIQWDGTGKSPAPLTPDERALVVQRSAQMQVKAGFYDRVATYCRSVDQLMAVFMIIKPIVYPAYAKFAVNDSESEKLERKKEAVAEILGNQRNAQFISDINGTLNLDSLQVDPVVHFRN